MIGHSTGRASSGVLFAVIALLGLVLLTGCAQDDSGPFASASDANVHPGSVTLDRGATQQFTAFFPLGGTPVWTAQGGEITDSGLYTAPDTPGHYRVNVYDASGSGLSGYATITVP